MTPRSASSAEVVAQAWAVVGRHSWRLLETGRLRCVGWVFVLFLGGQRDVGKASSMFLVLAT